MATNTNTPKAKATAYAVSPAMLVKGTQLRYRGATPKAYIAPLSALRAWAGAHHTNQPLVQALTHHGWRTGGNVAATAANPNLHEKLVAAVKAGNLPANLYAVGQPTAPQMAGAMAALAAAGAPTVHLAALWACYNG